VVEVVGGTAAAAGAARRAGAAIARRVAGAGGEALVIAVHRAAAAPPAAVAGASSTIDPRQFAAKAAAHAPGRMAVLPRPRLPLAGLELALDIDLGALAQVFLGDLDQPLVKDRDAVPLGALLALAGGAVAPVLRGRQPQIGDAGAVLGRADFRV